jgi:hypothetical protein
MDMLASLTAAAKSPKVAMAARRVELAVCCFLAGCATATGSSTGSVAYELIASAEVRDSESMDSSALDLVQRVRPLWLRPKVTSVTRGAIRADVYVNGSPRGDLESLRALPLYEIEEIRYYTPRDATTYFGTGHMGGVIDVRTR